MLKNHQCQAPTKHFDRKKNVIIINFNRAINYYNHC